MNQVTLFESIWELQFCCHCHQEHIFLKIRFCFLHTIVLNPLDCYCMAKNRWNILQNTCFCMTLVTKWEDFHFWVSQKIWLENRQGLLEIIEGNRESFYLNIKININLKIDLALSSCEHLQLISFVFHSGTTSRKLLYFLGTPQHK